MLVSVSWRFTLWLWTVALAMTIAGGCASSSGSGSKSPAGPSETADEPAKPSTGNHAVSEKVGASRRIRTPFDPIRDNGPIFVDWPVPKLAIVITGRQDGYLEPCGCAGLDRMRGGLGRREAMTESLRTKGWPLLLVDVGGISRRPGVQAMIKFRLSVEAMAEMGYGAIGLGTAELQLPAAELLTAVTGEEGRPGRFLSANVGLYGPAGRIVPQQRIIQTGEVKVGVTSVLGGKYQREIHNPDVEMSDPQVALNWLVDEMRPVCDVMILLAHAPQDECVGLARRFPQFDVVVTSDGPPIPPVAPTPIEGNKTMLVEVGEKVKDVVVLGWFGQSGKELRYQRVPLDSRFAVSAQAKVRMADYQEALRGLGLEGLGVRPMPHPRKPLQGEFVGAETCGTCHEAEYDVWKRSKHSEAMRTLVGLDPPRAFDPECLACHVTGWHPQGCYPYESGYLSQESSPRLAGVGCESCHGPGGAHAAAEAGGDGVAQRKLREAMRVTLADARWRVCVDCHDVSNSPDFELGAYWPDVAHGAEK